MRADNTIGALIVTGVVILGLAGPAAAAPDWPAPNGRCVDEVGVLGDNLCARITRVLVAEEQATSDEIAVAVVHTTGEATIEDWSTGLFNAWGVGEKVKNNGVLLVVAFDDHRVRLVTGRGLTERLTDTTAKTIVDTAITPRFADDAYAQGILAGLDEVRSRMGHQTAVAANRLVDLATVDTAPAGDGTEGEVSRTTNDFTDDTGLSDGSGFSDGSEFSAASDGGSGLAPFACFGAVVLAMIGVGVAISRGESSAGGAGRSAVRATRPRSRTHSRSAGFPATDNSSGFSSGSADSSAGFGGGGSDGGGASGSW